MADIKVEDNNVIKNHSVKKRKLDDGAEEKQPNIHSTIEDLSSFKLEKILNNNTRSKIVCLQGTFSDADGAGLVILEKYAFEEENLKSNSDYFSTSSCLKKVFHNDIYGNYEYYPVTQLNCKYCITFLWLFLHIDNDAYHILAIKATIIHPATEKHIEKYSIQNPYIVDETPDIYESIVSPFIIKEQFDLQVHRVATCSFKKTNFLFVNSGFTIS